MNNTEVVVIGGGLAGLTAATYVARAGHSVTVHEAKSRIGGRAATDEQNGFLLNHGPHALYLAGEASKILAELGVSLAGAAPPAGKVLFGGQLFLAPGSTSTLLRTKALGAKAKLEVGKVLGGLGKVRSEELAHLSANDWINGQVKQERSRQLLQAVARLTCYAGQLDELSADLAVGQMQIGLGDGVSYLDGGWCKLVKGLEQKLLETGNATIETGSKLTTMPDAPVVIVALNSPQAAASLLEQTIETGPAATVASLDLGVSSPPPVDFVLGGDEALYFSHQSASARLAADGQHLISVAAYLNETANNESNDSSAQPTTRPDRSTLETFAKLCGVDDTTIVHSRYLHRMVAASAIPTVALGGMKGRTSVDASEGVAGAGQQVLVSGDWVGDAGHLADASMASARVAASKAIARLSTKS